ncbi:TPA: hypothetical protein JBD49_03770 [Legionella pneumophila subsp. pneumophila]|nr:DNA methyltransferase [Legionella pneumophila]HAT7877845.1 hypothetical protein [Legionella pneumophila]HAT9698949.1 hypothetical protein [Legionella pneumophila subsp. pneumophila]
MGYSINFSGNDEPDNQRKVLRLQLGKRHLDLDKLIRNTSSSKLKQMLDVQSYSDLQKQAEQERISLNSYALKKIYEHVQNSSDKLFDGIEGTYRGNTDDFFHHLFPYLEAFSPNFVTAIKNKYAPDANMLLDPFGGLGTSPFTFAKANKKAYFCEVNPLMQRIAELKSYLIKSNDRNRAKAVEDIHKLLPNLDYEIFQQLPDSALRNNYVKVFGKSDFFPKNTFEQVLKIRTLIDFLFNQNFLLGVCLELSVLASLVPASNMQRAGDLRRKREKERIKISDNLIEHVSKKLNSFKEGLLSFSNSYEQPEFLIDDSRKLSQIPYLGVDLVITSPPYLNGTNYFRNTKIELWFIRGLREKNDLASYRDKAITAGINDVRGIRYKELPHIEIFESISSCIKRLDKDAYDPRIPQMIRWYAHDINDALSNTIKHLKTDGIIAVDIGDSIYCGVKVPTDLLIQEVLKNNNCSIIDNLIVRKRMSRSGQEVKQVCIVARKKQTINIKITQNEKQYFVKDWNNFKKELPHLKKPYSSRNWGHINHSICSYQGKLKPSIAKFLVDTFVPSGGKMLDPFCGVGTIPFEAALSGKQSYGFDISPAALAISRGKLWLPDKEKIYSKLNELDNFIKLNKDKYSLPNWFPSFNKELRDYYHKDTFIEILLAREWFKNNQPWEKETSILLGCSMHILHGNRPYALSRRSHPVTPFAPTGEFEYKSFMHKLEQKCDKTIEAEYPDNFKNGKVIYQDATQVWPIEINALDAIITSPPFFDSTRFYSANWIRLWFAGWDEKDFKFEQKRFVDEKQKISFDCYFNIIRQSKERLKTNGTLIFHLGKSNKCDMGERLIKIASKWFSNFEIFNESVAHCESHGIKDKGTVTDHQYLILW